VLVRGRLVYLFSCMQCTIRMNSCAHMRFRGHAALCFVCVCVCMYVCMYVRMYIHKYFARCGFIYSRTIRPRDAMRNVCQDRKLCAAEYTGLAPPSYMYAFTYQNVGIFCLNALAYMTTPIFVCICAETHISSRDPDGYKF
jgi:hypothetical protein